MKTSLQEFKEWVIKKGVEHLSSNSVTLFQIKQFEEEQKKVTPEWTIMEFKFKTHPNIPGWVLISENKYQSPCDNNLKESLNTMLHKGNCVDSEYLVIHSVRRNSDSTIWIVGDKLSDNYTILSFFIKEKTKMCVNLKTPIWKCEIVISLSDCQKQEVKTPHMRDYYGGPIYLGDTFWTIRMGKIIIQNCNKSTPKLIMAFKKYPDAEMYLKAREQEKEVPVMLTNNQLEKLKKLL